MVALRGNSQFPSQAVWRNLEATMERQQLLAALETEIRRHDFDCFVTNPPSSD
jgi:hypothetical protein